MKSIISSRLLSRTLVVSVLAVTAAFSSGCFLVAVGAAGAAGAGTVAYIKGELDASLEHPYETVSAAAVSAVGQLQLVLVSQTKDAVSTTVIARNGQDTKITITCTQQDANLTKVQIRVGVFGDEAFSRSILDQIKRNL